MKVQLIALSLLAMACSQQGTVSKTDDGKTGQLSDTIALPSDPLTVREAALNADDPFLPPGVALPEKFDKITKGDPYTLLRYKACTFTVLDEKDAMVSGISSFQKSGTKARHTSSPTKRFTSLSSTRRTRSWQPKCWKSNP